MQSPSCPVPDVVPRGSVLGPLLFILYAADVAEIPDMTWLPIFIRMISSCILPVVLVTMSHAAGESQLALKTSTTGWPQTG